MTDITFQNSEASWLVISLALFLLLVFIWKEYRQSGSRFILRLVASIIAIISLVLIVLRPATLAKAKNSQLVVLTDGYKTETLDSLKKANKNISIVNYKSDAPILNEDNIPSNVVILGHGIPKHDLWQLEGLETTYLASELPSGIIKLKYKHEISQGNRFLVAGEYHQPKKDHRLVLNDPGGTALDSIVFSEDGIQPFQFETSSNVVGNYVFNLVEKNAAGDIIQSDPLPITVKPQLSLNILILNGFPTFETKYLKNYLAEMGHQIRIRSQVTRGRFKYEYFNTSENTFPRLTKEDLDAYHLIIADMRSLSNLSKQQIKEIESAVVENGLGLFIQPEGSLTSSRSLLIPFKFSSDRNQEIILNSLPKLKLAKYPYQFNEAFLLEPIHISESKIISAYKRQGTGRIGTTLLFNTYELLLKGKIANYKQLWSEIIESISKGHTATLQWQPESKIAYLDEPFQFHLRANTEEPIVKNENGSIIPLKNSIYNKTFWSGTTYPKHKNWNKLTSEQDSMATFNFYVADTIHWKPLRALSTRLENQRRFNDQIKPSQSRLVSRSIHPFWFFCCFLLAMSYLWIDPKL